MKLTNGIQKNGLVWNAGFFNDISNSEKRVMLNEVNLSDGSIGIELVIADFSNKVNDKQLQKSRITFNQEEFTSLLTFLGFHREKFKELTKRTAFLIKEMEDNS